MFLSRTLKPFLKLAQPSRFLMRPIYSFSTTPTPQISEDEVEGKIYQLLRMLPKCKQDRISKKATFEELGLDSLDAVEVVVSIEEMFGVDLPDKVAESISDVNSAIQAFHKQLNEPSSSSKPE